ncbi:MAG TPA: hypothetical protein VNQ99_12300 [Xanthobacteraceae bacterium]|nr:hypothetical protein [Xanthobacteraceae bacterium]
MASKQLSDGGAEGTVLGQSASDLISLHGATPVAQYGTVVTLATGATIATAVTVVQQVVEALKLKGILPSA